MKYIPSYYKNPAVPQIVSIKERAWEESSVIIYDIMKRFEITNGLAIDIGVLYGYSTCVLANYFKEVIGIDTFRENRYNIKEGKKSNFNEVKEWVSEFNNITLIESLWQDVIDNVPVKPSLVHIDIIHNYEETYKCGEWAVQHCDHVIFHDTLANPEVLKACEDLGEKYGFDVYNYENDFGLGILVKRKKMEHFNKDFIGWFTFSRFYRDTVNRLKNGSIFVEVGVYEGKSLAYFLTEMINAGKDFDVTAVDSFTFEGVLDNFTRNMQPVVNKFDIIIDLSWEAANDFEDESVDCVFIDASHLYDDFKRDVTAWWPKIKVGGMICGHDLAIAHPDVEKVLNETWGDEWNRQYQDELVWYKIKK
jgi:predicted O-methyltransferase YrrM